MKFQYSKYNYILLNILNNRVKGLVKISDQPFDV